MRSVEVKAWCDMCNPPAPEPPVTPAVEVWTVGVTTGEQAPALRVLETCQQCGKEIRALLDLVAPLEPYRPSKPITTTPAGKIPAKPKAAQGGAPSCPVCWQEFASRESVIGHVWNTHRKGEQRPAPPLECPEPGCNYNGPARSVGVHRANAHGWDALANALDGVKGLK